MARNVLSYKFQSAAHSALSAGCADGQRMTRESLCEALVAQGYETTPDLVGVLVESGTLDTSTQAWGLFRGRYGGIRERDLAGEQAEREAEAAAAAKTAAIVAKRQATIAARKAAEAAVAPAPEAPEAPEAPAETATA